MKTQAMKIQVPVETNLFSFPVLLAEDSPASSGSPASDLLGGDLFSGELMIAEAEVSPTMTPAPVQFGCFWKVFGSTFATIFLAELGDKTQVSTLLMSAEFHAPWTVFAGAAAALITTSLLGVLVGQWLSQRLSPKTLDTAAGVTLALMAIMLLWDVAGM